MQCIYLSGLQATLAAPSQVTALHPVKIIIKGETTAQSYAVIDQYFGKGNEVALHYHTRESHSAMVLVGKFRVAAENCIWHLQAGDAIFIPVYLRHSFEAVDEINIMRIFVFPAGLEKIFETLSVSKERGADIDNVYKKFGINFEKY